MWLVSVQLFDALRYSQGMHLAFVGAGGKTTALFKLARELSTILQSKPSKKTVLVTTSTHFGAWQVGLADHFVRIKSMTDITRLEHDLPEGVVLLAGEENNNRLSGLKAKELERVHSFAKALQLPLIIEADGAHTRPIKAPDRFEPVIPDFINHVVVVAGLSALGKPLTDKWVHRYKIFAELSGLSVGEVVNRQALVNVLRHERGGLKNIPPTARKTVLLNQADTAELQSQGQAIATQLIHDYQSVIIASLASSNEIIEPENGSESVRTGQIHAVIEQVAGVVLAAGGSSRFGKPKQLLLWKGQPLIRHVVLAALQSGLSPVIVVIGAAADEVRAAISDLTVRIANNQEWVQGISGSIKSGITCLPKELGAVVFLQADQPQVSPLMITKLIEIHQQTLAPIVVPQIDGQRANPVLFDVNTFPALQALEGDVGGRALFSKFPVQWVDWHDQKLLMDIDSPEDYQKFLEMYPNEG